MSKVKRFVDAEEVAAINKRVKKSNRFEVFADVLGADRVTLPAMEGLRTYLGQQVLDERMKFGFDVILTQSAVKLLKDLKVEEWDDLIQYGDVRVIKDTEDVPPMMLAGYDLSYIVTVRQRKTVHPFVKSRRDSGDGVGFYFPIGGLNYVRALDVVDAGDFYSLIYLVAPEEVSADVVEVVKAWGEANVAYKKRGEERYQQRLAGEDDGPAIWVEEFYFGPGAETINPKLAAIVEQSEDVEVSNGVHVVPEDMGDFEELEGQVFIFPQPVDNVVEEPARVAETCLIPGESFADMVSNTIKYRAITVPAMPDRAPSVHLEPTWTRDSICVADSKKVSWDWNGHPMDHKTTHYNQAARDLGWSEVGTLLEVVGVDGPAMFLCERGEVQAVFDLLEDPESAPEDLEDNESTASHSLPFEPLRMAEKALQVTKKQAKKLTNKLQHNGWLLVDVEYVDDESGDVEWMMFDKRGEWVRVHLEGWLVLGADLATPYGNAPSWFLRDAKEYDYMQRSVLAQ